jgi:hypothetical protein
MDVFSVTRGGRARSSSAGESSDEEERVREGGGEAEAMEEDWGEDGS